MMRCEVFAAPLDNAEHFIDFAPADVVKNEEKRARLFLRGRHRVTAITKAARATC